MQAPQLFGKGVEVILHYPNGYQSGARTIVEWTGVGIVTATDETGATFTPYHRINTITLVPYEQENASTNTIHAGRLVTSGT